MSEAYIDLSAITRNAEKIKKIVPLCAVVKADAYGHGARDVAKKLTDTADSFAVATLEEAEELLGAGIKKDIIVLGKSHCILPAENVVYTVDAAEEVDRLCRISSPRLAVKINTGMNRYGIGPESASGLIRYVKERARLHSVYSHLRAPENVLLSAKQLSSFELAAKGVDVPRHLCASGGLALGKEYLFDFARCGIALYGGTDDYEQAMTVTAPILEVRRIAAGEGVGYGAASFDGEAYVAVIGIGYADGYRKLSAPRYVSIDGFRCEVVSVCMDVCFAVVPPCVRRDDSAEILGKNIAVSELAASYGTITYEVFTSFGKRVTKKYG